MMFLSVVLPVYKSQDSLRPLLEELHLHLKPWTYELIFVVDGSPDQSIEVLKELAENDPRIKILSLSRNFGQHFAITAGLDHAKGDYTIVMDCDLQHDPKDIPLFIQEALAGVDIVLSRHPKREFGLVKNIFAHIFHFFFKLIGGKNLYESDIGTFSLLNKKARLAFCKVRDKHRHYLFIVKTIGFRTKIIEVAHRPRRFGRSSYTLGRLLVHAIDGIVSGSTHLLYLSVLLGVILELVAGAFLIYFLFLYTRSHPPPGWLSIMTLITFFSGMNLFFLGIIGMYIAKLFEQVKDRPLYIVSESINF